MSLTEASAGKRPRWDWRYWTVVLAVFALVASKWDARSGFTSLLRFGDPWHAKRLTELQHLPVAKAPNSGGYDGQFYAQIATSPLLQSEELERAIDAPAYRARRIFMPWIAALLGAGNPWWTLQVFALLNLVAWCVLAWWLYREIGDEGATGFARWTGCVLSLGVLESVRQSLVDLPALTFVALSLSAWRVSRFQTAAWTGALAVLTKETAWLAIVALPRRRRSEARSRESWWRGLGLVVLALVPLMIWLGWIAARFGRWSETGLAGNFGWPGVAIARQSWAWVDQLAAGQRPDRAVFGLIGIISFSIQAVVLWWRADRDSAWWRVGALHTILMLLLGEWVWGGYWAAARALLPLTVAFNLLLPAGRGFWFWWTVGNVTLLHGLIRFV